jgi:hypothetical protein
MCNGTAGEAVDAASLAHTLYALSSVREYGECGPQSRRLQAGGSAETLVKAASPSSTGQAKSRRPRSVGIC